MCNDLVSAYHSQFLFFLFFQFWSSSFLTSHTDFAVLPTNRVCSCLSACALALSLESSSPTWEYDWYHAITLIPASIQKGLFWPHLPKVRCYHSALTLLCSSLWQLSPPEITLYICFSTCLLSIFPLRYKCHRAEKGRDLITHTLLFIRYSLLFPQGLIR